MVVDLTTGQVVGKSELDTTKNKCPKLLVAPGADATAVAALTCVLHGEL